MPCPQRQPDRGQLEGHPTVDHVEAARLSRCSFRAYNDSVLRPELDDPQFHEQQPRALLIAWRDATKSRAMNHRCQVANPGAFAASDE